MKLRHHVPLLCADKKQIVSTMTQLSGGSRFDSAFHFRLLDRTHTLQILLCVRTSASSRRRRLFNRSRECTFYDEGAVGRLTVTDVGEQSVVAATMVAAAVGARSCETSRRVRDGRGSARARRVAASIAPRGAAYSTRVPH